MRRASRVCHLDPAERTSNDTPRVGAAIAALATGQHGVVEHGQLLALGLSRSAIARLVEAGWLHRLHPGVYAVGQPRLTAKGTWLASVLACGPGAALSHRAAAALWGLRPSLGTAEVTVGTTARRVPGVRVHRSRTLEPKDVTVSDEIRSPRLRGRSSTWREWFRATTWPRRSIELSAYGCPTERISTLCSPARGESEAPRRPAKPSTPGVRATPAASSRTASPSSSTGRSCRRRASMP